MANFVATFGKIWATFYFQRLVTLSSRNLEGGIQNFLRRLCLVWMKHGSTLASFIVYFHAFQTTFKRKYCRLLRGSNGSNLDRQSRSQGRWPPRPESNLFNSFISSRKSFFKYGPIPASFCLFLFFSHYNFNTNWKSVDGVFGIQTWGRMIIGADETTELWRPPYWILLLFFLLFSTHFH